MLFWLRSFTFSASKSVFDRIQRKDIDDEGKMRFETRFDTDEIATNGIRKDMLCKGLDVRDDGTFVGHNRNSIIEAEVLKGSQVGIIFSIGGRSFSGFGERRTI